MTTPTTALDWLDSLIYGIRHVQIAGVPTSDRTTINVIGGTVVDNPGQNRIDITIPATVTAVTATAPIVSSGGSAPVISISPASGGAAGSMSASDKTKLDTSTAAATNSALAQRDGTARIAFSGIDLDATTAVTGVIRLGSSSNAKWRTSGVDKSLFALDGADGISFGDTNAASIASGVKTGGSFSWAVNAVAVLALSASALTASIVTMQFAASVASPTIKQADATSGTIGQALTLKGQKAFNGKGGQLTLAGGDPTSTNQAGDVIIDLGQLDATTKSAKLSILANASTDYLDIQVIAGGAGVAISSTTQLQFSSSNNIIFTSTGAALYFDSFTGGGTPTLNFRGVGSAQSLTLSYPHNGAQTLQHATGATSITYSQADNTTNSATGAVFKIQAANATGTTATGGDLVLTSGTGTTASGSTKLQAGGTTRVQANGTGLGFYAVAPIAQATRAGQITDNTGGTPSTTFAAITAGAAYAQADMTAVKNALASIATQYNKIDTIIHNLGLST